MSFSPKSPSSLVFALGYQKVIKYWRVAPEILLFHRQEVNIQQVPLSTQLVAYLQDYTHFVWEMTILDPLFVSTHFHTISEFKTPLSTRKFGHAGYCDLNLSRPPGRVNHFCFDPDRKYCGPEVKKTRHK